MYTKSDSVLGRDVMDFVKAIDKDHMEQPAGRLGR
jgi:hypothetical protein